MTTVFPSFVNEEDNQRLLEEIEKDELQLVLYTIHPINKSGSSADPNKYRTIMVGNTLSKLYVTVLHMLSRELEWRQLRARGQALVSDPHIRPSITF